MSICVKYFYDSDSVEICRVCKNVLIKSNSKKTKTKKNGYRSEYQSCCKMFFYDNRHGLLNNMKVYDKENREKTKYL